MQLPPFLLSQFLAEYEFADPPIAFNLASSTGPRWTLDALSALGALGAPPQDAGATSLGYAPAEGSRDLREAVAAFHETDPGWVTITTGASEALWILLSLLEREHGNVVIPDPAYPAYAALAAACRLATRPYPLWHETAFTPAAGTVLHAVNADTVAVIVNTPHNPTGAVMPLGEISALAAALAEIGVPLIVDEVYHPLYFGAPQPSAAGIANVIVTSDLSKAMSLPGLRTGWIIDADAQRRARAIDARSYFTISGSPLLERLATHALHQSGPILARLRAVAARNLTLLDRQITAAAGTLSWVAPRGGTTAFAWFTDGRDSRAFCRALARAGVLVAPGDCFGHPSHMRIGFAQQEAGFAAAMRIFGGALEG